jgi:DNA-binding transcriptional LysR family regulator
MELRQLRYLVALADERHFTRAAQRAAVAQPALSRQIRKLEDELGIALVSRTTRRVSLTDAGERLVRRARRALAEVDAALWEANELLDLVLGSVDAGVTPTPGPLDIARELGSFHELHPGIDLRLREEMSVTLADLLRVDALDMAFITAVDASSLRGLEVRPIARESLVVCLAPHHRFAGRQGLSLADLRDERFIAFRRGATIRDQVHHAAARVGFEPRIAFESSDAMRIRSLVSRGLGVAVLPRSDAEGPGPFVAVAEIEDASLIHEVFLAWRSARELSPAAAMFVRGFIGSTPRSTGGRPRRPAGGRAASAERDDAVVGQAPDLGVAQP